jgi:hypothetical protein
MKVLVLKGFANKHMSCSAGQTVELTKELYDDLTSCGYVKPITAEKKPATKNTTSKKKPTKE